MPSSSDVFDGDVNREESGDDCINLMKEYQPEAIFTGVVNHKAKRDVEISIDAMPSIIGMLADRWKLFSLLCSDSPTSFAASLCIEGGCVETKSLDLHCGTELLFLRFRFLFYRIICAACPNFGDTLFETRSCVLGLAD